MDKNKLISMLSNNKNIDSYIKNISNDFNELKSDLMYQLLKISEEKLLNAYNNDYIEYMCFKICKRIKYGNIKDSEFFYKKQNIEDISNRDVQTDNTTYRYDLLDIIEEDVKNLHWYSKTLFNMYYVDGYNYREISEKTGINIKSISHNINNTKKNLKNKYKKDDRIN